MSFKRLAVRAAAAVGLSVTAPAAVIINMVEQGSNVVATATGTLDFASTYYDYVGTIQGYLDPSSASIHFGAAGSFINAVSYFADYTSGYPSSFGTGGQTNNSTATGSAFGIQGDTLLIPDAYVFTDITINSSATWNNATFLSLGVTSGTYTWTFYNETVTLNIGGQETATPEPGTLSMLGGAGIAVIAFARRARA